ncbi:MAG TPA: hypothetical protein VGB79_12795 [Allosphingosinicella sp.]|jgi:hypothetical protein
MNAIASLLALLALGQGAGAASGRIAQLERACEMVQRAYPMLMLAAMAEGRMDCGDPDSGVSVDCDADDTPEERTRQARRLQIRQQQEAAFKPASEACFAWDANRRSPALQDEVVRTFRAARQAGTDLPPEVRD